MALPEKSRMTPDFQRRPEAQGLRRLAGSMVVMSVLGDSYYNLP